MTGEERRPEPRLLVVEDDAAQRELLCEILNHEGFSTIGCATGREALDRVEERDFAVAIVDHRLPDLTGIQVLEHIRTCDESIPVIVHTAFGSFASAKDAVNLGAFAFLEKPSEPEELIRHVHRAVQRHMELALRRSEARYRDLTEISPVGIFHTDAEGAYAYVNRRWCEIAGIDAEAAKGGGWKEALHPVDCDRVGNRWQEAVAEHGPFQAEFRFLQPSGRTVWVYGQTKPEIDDDGEVVGYVGTLTDITERKLAESSLRLLDLALQQTGIALCITTAGDRDEAPRIVYVNPAFARLIGYEEEELIGHPLGRLHGSRTDHDLLDSGRERLERGESFSGELIYYRKDGRELPVSLLIDPVRDDDGEVRHWVTLCR